MEIRAFVLRDAFTSNEGRRVAFGGYYLSFIQATVRCEELIKKDENRAPIQGSRIPADTVSVSFEWVPYAEIHKKFKPEAIWRYLTANPERIR